MPIMQLPFFMHLHEPFMLFMFRLYRRSPRIYNAA